MLPVFYFYGFGFRLSDVLVLMVIPVLFFYKPGIPRENIFYLYALVVLSFVLSAFYGYGFLGVPVSFGDLNEIIKISAPLLLMFCLYRTDIDFLIKIVIKLLYYGSFVVLIVAAVEFLFPGSLGYSVSSMYGTGYQLEHYRNYHAKRIFVTGSDPNTGAAIVLLFLEFNIICFVVKRNFRSLLLSFLLLAVLLLTGSRTGLVAFTVSLAMIFLITKARFKAASSFVIFIIIALVFVWAIPKIPYIYIGFETMLSGQNTSMLARLSNVQEAYDLFGQSVFFGWGPAKAIHSTRVDSEYFLILRRYGLLGYASLSVFMAYNMIRIFRNRTSLYINDTRSYLLAILILVYSFSAAVIMVTNNFISGYQLLLPYMLITFLVHFKISHIKKGSVK